MEAPPSRQTKDQRNTTDCYCSLALHDVVDKSRRWVERYSCLVSAGEITRVLLVGIAVFGYVFIHVGKGRLC